MSEETTLAVQPEETVVPDAWGSREEIREIATRLKKFVPGTKKMNDAEIMAYAQLVHITGLNPCSDEIYGWDSRGNGTGDLVTKQHYAVLVRWAKSQENFTTNFTCVAIGSTTEDTVFECRLLRQSDRPLLGQLLANNVDYQEALSWATTTGTGIVAATEKGKRPPPKGKDWCWVARKRALEDAIRQAFGKPSTQELARQTWIVEDVVTIPSDWEIVTPEMSPAERAATAKYNANRRLTPPSTLTFAESMDELGFPPDVTTVIPSVAVIDAGTGEIVEPPPEPELQQETGQAPPEATGGNGNGNVARPASPAVVKDWLTQKAEAFSHYKPPTDGQLGLMNGLLSKILGGDKERRSWLDWTWGDPSSKGMPGSQVGATLTWLKPEKDPETNEYIPHPFAVSECKMMLRQAMLDKGQVDMFDNA